MPENVYAIALQRIEAGTLSAADLVTAAAELGAAGQIPLARQLYRTWLDASPNDPQAYVALFNCSALDAQLGDKDAAAAALQKAIALNPDFLPAYINLGGMLERAGAVDQAIELWRTGVSRPARISGNAVVYTTTALKQIARVLTDRHQSEAAEAVVRLCLEIEPAQPEIVEQYVALRLAQCRWPILEPMERLDREALARNIHPLSMAVFTDDPLLQLGAADRYVRSQAFDRPQSPALDRRHAPIDLSNRRLRVGYVSSDLRDHAIGYLMAELFELHDRSKVEIFAYYCGPESSSPLNARIKGAVEHWIDIRNMSNDEAAERIGADGIDILVDVNGHTRDSRTAVFARRPAPIQVNWLGYPGTMATPYHHYIIADEWIIPREAELYYTEKVVRLPCYQPNDRTRAIAERMPARREAGLPDDAFVFCCFNGTHKITRFTFQRWLDILKRVPNSVLWLLECPEETRSRLAAFAEANGVARERIIYAPRMANPDHLARYRLADLFLDTSPYGAHTTASDALWMGVPVLTLTGRAFASRVCGSLVRAAGLPELVCATPADYVALAASLGNDRTRVEALRSRLEANRSSCILFDTNLLARRLEELYRSMCADYARGDLPQPELINLDRYLEAGISHDHEAEEVLAIGDYHGWYKERLAKLHFARPLLPDHRLWRAADIARAENAGAAHAHRAQPSRAPEKSMSSDIHEGESEALGEAIAELLKRNPSPFFVQVGGFDGVSFDPLRRHVVDKNLAGLIVEPIPQYFEKLRALYTQSPNVVTVNCAVSEEDGERVIWRFSPEAVERGILPPHFAGISSFLMDELLKDTGVLGRSSPNKETTEILRSLLQAVPVQCRTMNSLLAEHGVKTVDILQIDTEGYDYNILKLFDFERFRPAIVHYEHQHLGPADRDAAERLLRSYGYDIHRKAYDTLAVQETSGRPAHYDVSLLRGLAASLNAEGRAKDSIIVLEHLARLDPQDGETLLELVRSLGKDGRVLDALHRLAEFRAVAHDTDILLAEVRTQSAMALAAYNECLASKQIDEAEKIAAALAALLPGNVAVQNAALSCNVALGRRDGALRFANAIMAQDPAHEAARAVLAGLNGSSAPSAGDDSAGAQAEVVNPLLKLRDIHDATSAILCERLDLKSVAQIEQLRIAGRNLAIGAPAGSEWHDWEKHYRLMLEAVDMPLVLAPTPDTIIDRDTVFASSSGKPMNWKSVQATAKRLGARVVFFAAADENYIDQYARWYALSILKYCDVPFIVIAHVIGGAGHLSAVANAVGIEDERLIYAGDRFDADAVKTRCYDAPPKGRSERPVAHFQSARFQRAGALLDALKLPVFVSDIDLLLQRGVADLLARHASDDLVLNENTVSKAAGSRLTANLLLLNPTENASMFLRFLRSYLDRVLKGEEVTRWIDQLALVLARHHLVIRSHAARIGYFDTKSDINNVMYRSYQQHPFRFLSLYHGFDTSSLEKDPRVLGGDGVAGRSAEKRPVRRKASVTARKSGRKTADARPAN